MEGEKLLQEKLNMNQRIYGYNITLNILRVQAGSQQEGGWSVTGDSGHSIQRWASSQEEKEPWQFSAVVWLYVDLGNNSYSLCLRGKHLHPTSWQLVNRSGV